MDKYNEIKAFLISLEDDFNKFYEKGNKAAGTRIRKSMQELKKMAQAIREGIQNEKNKE